MQIFVTELFAESAKEAGINDLQPLVDEFRWWKQTWDPKKGSLGAWEGGPACREFASTYFGKDGANRTPLVEGVSYALRHVHLPPINDDESEQWMRYHELGKRKTSDCFLMYASDRYYKHVLLYVLPEPEAHAVVAMKTKEDRELMEWMAEEAARFLDGDMSAIQVA